MKKTSYRTVAASFGALMLALLCGPTSWALCGVRQPAPTHSNWYSQPQNPQLLRAALLMNDDRDDHDRDDPSIVGLWHIKFVSGGSEIDAGYAQWHSDGSEIMNSGSRPPLTSNFCLGVWKKVGERQYKLNHFAISWDPTGTSLLGPANIAETVTLSRDGNTFSGTFTLTQYDEAGNSLGGAKGTIKGTRIDVNTPPSSIF